MEPCVCSTLRHLVKNYDEKASSNLAAELNCFLKDLRALLSKSKSLARDVEYQITPNNQRIMKALVVNSVNLQPVNDLCTKYNENVSGFWQPSDDAVHAGLHRRLVCAVVYLRSKLDIGLPIPPQIATLFKRNQNYTELKNSGRKYIKIARKLGSLGALFWLPLDIPHSTYERYLNMDDEEVFAHLKSLEPKADFYAGFVRQLILSQFQDLTPSYSYHNLFPHCNEAVPAADQLLLLLFSLGGSDIPRVLIESIRSPQRRWNEHGEMSNTSSTEFGLPSGLIELISDDEKFRLAMANPHITEHTNDGIMAVSLSSEMMAYFSTALLPVTIAELNDVALRAICFACPPCYEGNTYWSSSLKGAIWPLLEKMAKPEVVQEPLRTEAVIAVLYFCERDSVPLRRVALFKSRTLLRRSMPYYLHASVVLFQSILHRLDGDLGKSEAVIRDFVSKGLAPKTRRDVAIQGRLHISQIESKIRSYDMDVPSFIYKWEAEQPLSRLEIEVTSRLQGVAARFFQSIGDFAAAGASLEQYLSLDSTSPIQTNTRRLIVGRLADIYSELEQYDKAAEILRPELEGTDNSEHCRRPYRRLLLSLTESNIGLGQLDTAEVLLDQLKQLCVALPPQLDNIHDEQLFVRGLLASARISHLRGDLEEAIRKWRHALQEIRHLQTLKWQGSFTEAVMNLSLAHAQMASGDRDGTRHSWTVGIDILRREKCEFWIPIVPTLWLKKVVMEVHEQLGWSFRMMLPGGRPDMTWPF